MGVFYALTNVYSPKAQPAQLRTTFADGIAVWWNGTEVLRVHRHPKWLLMRTSGPRPGPSVCARVGIPSCSKIEPSLMVPTAFLFRLLGPDGETLRGISYAADTSSIPAPQQEQISLSVDVPPGAVAWMDGKPVTGGTYGSLATVPDSRTSY